MREIKFRGKDLNDNWHYGLLTHDKTPSFKTNYKWFISNKSGKPYAYGVIEETIGQYTGLKDKYGVEIYEGDIVIAKAKDGYEKESLTSDVLFNPDDGWQIRTDGVDSRYGHGLPITWGGWTSIEVIGNIHENIQDNIHEKENE